MGLREDLHALASEQEFRKSELLQGVMSRLEESPRERGSHRLAPAASGVVAAVLALVLIVTLVVSRQALQSGMARQLTSPANGATLPVSTAITGIVGYQFVSPQVGWLIVEGQSAATVYGTADGGRSWKKQLKLLSPSSLNLTPPHMQFFDALNGIVVGQQGSEVTVWRTSDGGADWAAHSVPSHSAEFAVSGYFLDSRHGWVLTTSDRPGGATVEDAATASVYATSDGGNTWSSAGLVHAGVGGVTWVGITFVTPSTGFVTAQMGGQATLALFATRDGGANWAGRALAAPFNGVFTEAEITFSGTHGILLVGANREGACMSGEGGSLGGTCTETLPAGRYLYSTADSGRTWLGPRYIGNSYVEMIDGQRWIRLDSGGLSTTVDAGTTWSPPRRIAVPARWFATRAQFLNPFDGWIALTDTSEGNFPGIGSAGPAGKVVLLSTIDGGLTWVAVPLPKG